MKNINKLVLGMMIAGLSSMSFAGSTTATVTVTGTYNNGCIIEENPNYNFDNIPSGSVGKSTAVTLYANCMATTYNLVPETDSVTVTGGPEVLTITAWKNSSFTQQLTNASPISSYSNGLQANMFYLKVNGPVGNTDNGDGPVLTKTQSFTATFPLKLVY